MIFFLIIYREGPKNSSELQKFQFQKLPEKIEGEKVDSEEQTDPIYLGKKFILNSLKNPYLPLISQTYPFFFS